MAGWKSPVDPVKPVGAAGIIFSYSDAHGSEVLHINVWTCMTDLHRETNPVQVCISGKSQTDTNLAMQVQGFCGGVNAGLCLLKNKNRR